MTPTIADDRTPEERETCTMAVVGTDKWMSGWGGAAGGKSFAAWACSPSDLPRVERWVRSRGDMSRTRVVRLADWRPRAAHTHIYVAEPGRHPAFD